MVDKTDKKGEDDPTIEHLNTLTRVGRANWFGLMAYLAFAFVTVLSVRDVDFFVDTNPTQLPLIGVAIPTFSFFWAAPFLGTALYIYLHLHIRKVVDAAMDPNLHAPNGGWLEDHLTPWLLVDMLLLSRRERGDKSIIRPRPMDGMARIIAFVLVWAAGPFVALFFWWRSVPANEEGLTIWLGILFCLTLWAGLHSWFVYRDTLPRGRWYWLGWLLRVLWLGWLLHPHWLDWLLRPHWLKNTVVVLATVVISWLGTEGGFVHFITAPLLEKAKPETFSDWRFNLNPRRKRRLDLDDRDTWTRRMLERDDPPYEPSAADKRYLWWWQWQDRVLDHPPRKWSWVLRPADMSNVVLSALPPEESNYLVARHKFRIDYCARRGIGAEVCGRTPSSRYDPPAFEAAQRLKWCENRKGLEAPEACTQFFADLNKNMTAEWKQYRADRLFALPKPDLSGRDLRFANLWGSKLTGINLSDAQMEGADLRFAQMEGADLSFAKMEGANLSFAKMEGADLRFAQMEGADLSFAKMEGANLSFAKMEGADLSDAQMEGADLSFAKMEGANLSFAQMEGADLSDAKMEGANLRSAKMRSVSWAEASVPFAIAHDTDLSDARGLSQGQLDQMVGDEWTKLPKPAAGDPPFTIPSCWDTPPPMLDDIVRRMEWSEERRAELKTELVCSPHQPQTDIHRSPRRLTHAPPLHSPRYGA